MMPFMRCPSCGCSMAYDVRCHSCRRPFTSPNPAPEHLFGPPSTDRRNPGRSASAQ